MLDPAQMLRAVGAELGDLYDAVEVPTGIHAVNGRLSLAFAGAIEKLPDIPDAKPNVTLPLPVVLALITQRAGVRAEKLQEIVIEAAILAFRTEEPAGQFIDLSTAALQEAKQRIQDSLPAQPKRGALRRILTIDNVEMDGAGISVPKRAKKKRA